MGTLVRALYDLAEKRLLRGQIGRVYIERVYAKSGFKAIATSQWGAARGGLRF